MQIGDLSVKIGADTAGLTAGLAQAKTSINGFEGAAAGLSKVLGGLFAVMSVRQFAGFIKDTIDAADNMGKLSQKLGIGTQELSKLQYAADLAGISNDSLTSSLTRLTKGMSDASQGSGEALNAFRALGINVTTADGSLRSSSEVMGDVADMFAQMEDGANKTALAIAIFGRAGAQMIPLLNGGRQAIKDAGDELERLGGVILPDAAKQAEKFNDNLTRLQTGVKGVGISIANDLMPTLIKLSEEFLVAEKHALSFFDKMQLGLRNPFKNYQEIIRDIDKELAYLGDKNSLRYDADKAASLQRQRAYYAEMAQIQALAGASGDYSDAVSRRFKPVEQPKIKAPALVDPKAAEAERKQLREKLDAVRQSLMNESDLAQEKYNTDRKILEEAKAKGLVTEAQYLTDVRNLQIDHQKKQWEIAQNSPDALAAQKAAEKLIALENSLIAERDLLIEDYKIKDQMLRDKYTVNGEITAEGQKYLEALEKQHQDKLTDLVRRGNDERAKFDLLSMKDKVKTVASHLMQITNGVANTNKTLFDLNKAAGIANAIINAYEGISLTMSKYPYPLNIAMAAAHGAAAFAQVRAISSQQFSGGKSGGGGGAAPALAGSTAATPVSVVNNAGGGGAGNSGQVVTINLTGEIFGRDQVRGLIGQLNEAIADGAILRVQ